MAAREPKDTWAKAREWVFKDASTSADAYAEHIAAHQKATDIDARQFLEGEFPAVPLDAALVEAVRLSRKAGDADASKLVEALRVAGRNADADELERRIAEENAKVNNVGRPKSKSGGLPRPVKTPLNAQQRFMNERLREVFKAYKDVTIWPCPDEDAIEVLAATPSKRIQISALVTIDRDGNIVLQSVRWSPGLR